MLKFFRNQQPASLILLLIVLIFTRAPFFFLENLQFPASYLGIGMLNLKWSLLITAIIIFVQAIVINIIFTNSQFLTEKTVVPALIWILITSVNQGFLVVGFPIVISSLVIILAQLFMTEEGHKVSHDKYFFAGIIFGVMSLLHPVFIIISPLFMVVIYNLNAIGVRDYLIFILGVILPFFWSWSYAYITDQSLFWLNRWEAHFGWLHYTFNRYEIILWSIMGVFVLMGLGSQSIMVNSASANRKKNVRTLLLIFIGLLISFLLSRAWSFSNMMMLLVPATFWISMFLLIIRKIKIAEWVFGIFVLTVVGSIVGMCMNFY